MNEMNVFESNDAPRCKKCIHYEVCKYRPPEDNEEAKRIVQEYCEQYISEEKVVDPERFKSDVLNDLEADLSEYNREGHKLDVYKWICSRLGSEKEVET